MSLLDGDSMDTTPVSRAGMARDLITDKQNKKIEVPDAVKKKYIN